MMNLKMWLMTAGVSAALLVVGGCDDNGASSVQNAASAVSAPATSTPAAAQVASSNPQASLTGPQRNAVRSAQDYLNTGAFSRAGLIRQLSSREGDAYDVADATAAVDSMNIDWNQQAAESAKDYLNSQGFSCEGLIQQLSSSAGEGYTLDQATYGAKQAGACQ